MLHCNRRPVPRHLTAAALLALTALTGSACGSALTDDEVRQANAVQISNGGSAAPTTTPPIGAAAAAGTVPDGAAAVTSTTAAGTGPSQTAPGGAPAALPTVSTAPRPGTRSPTVTAPTSPAAGATKPTSGSPAPAAPGGGPAPEAVGTPGETGPIIIGSVGNYSGPAGASVKGGVDALQAWASYTNDRGGLFGRRVQVIVQDDGGDPARYGSALRDLVETRGVVAFVYNSAALSMEGGIDYLNKKGVPVIGNDCAVEQWFNSPVFFPQCAPIADEIIGMIRAGVKTTGKTKYGFAACREAKTCEQQTPIQQRAGEGGAQLVYQGSISLTQVDFTSECRAAKSAGVEIMNLIADTATFVRFARSCNRQDFRPTYLALGIEVGGDVIAQPGMETTMVANLVFPFAGVSGGAFDEYNAVMKNYLARQPGPSESFGWASAKMFQAAATKAAQMAKSIKSDTLVAAMHTMKNETFGGLTVPLTFTGKTPANAPCIFVVKGDGAGAWKTPLGTQPLCS